MTVRRSLFLALVVAMVPLVALGVAAYAIAQSAAGDDSRADADRAAQLAAEVLEQRLAAAHDELAGVAEWPELILPSLGVVRGGGEDQRVDAQVAVGQALTWWRGYDSLTVVGAGGVVVTTDPTRSSNLDPQVLDQAVDGQVVAGGWDEAAAVFQVARPLVGADGDAALVATISTSYITDAIDRLDEFDARVLTADGAGVFGEVSPDAVTAEVLVDGTPWTVEVGVGASDGRTNSIVVATVVAGVLLLALVTLAVVVLGGSISRRLRRLAATAQAIGEGRLDQRVGLVGRDEVAQAAVSFDRMADSLMTDISRRRQMETLLVQQALHDPLTGLANRAKLLDRLGDALVRSSGSGRSVGLLFCDLDGFKSVNDELGHSAGDDLLMLVADRFRSSVRPSDTIARFGGDEFVVLCADLRHPDDVLAVADRLCAAFHGPFQLGSATVHTSASIGIAVGAGGSAAPDDLLRRADQAMYQAKDAGKSQYIVYELTADEEQHDRSERASEITQAIAGGQLALHYQPVIDVDLGRIVGHEAFVRWRHPDRGDVRPQELIELATSAGLAADVDLWVLNTAIDELQPPASDGAPPDEGRWIAVNLTPGSLATDGFSEKVSEVLQSRDLDPASIVLEVSEAALSGEPGTVLATLDELHGLGVGLAIDDFGTGHSSLDRLRRCPIDTIKIHQTLVHGVVADPDDRAAVQAIVSMAEALELSVIAEGVESREQLAVLTELGCRWAQGYHLASPVPVDELPPLVPDDAS